MHHTCRNISIFLMLNCCLAGFVVPAELIAQSVVIEDNSLARGSRPSNIGPIEKLMVIHDRELYLEGDTIWLRIINTDLYSGKPIELSSTAYVELLGPGEKILARQKINMTNEGGQGWIRIPENILSGNYYLRTYTSWMKNFHPSGYTYTLISIVNPFIPLYFAQRETGKDKQGKIDAELYPEGGHLIAGVENRIVVSLSGVITSKDSLLGEIRDEQDNFVSRVQFISTGIGYFSLTPLETKDYHLFLIMNGTRQLSVPVPQAQKGGYTLDWTENMDLLTVKISKYPSYAGQSQQLWLTGKASGQVLFHVPAELENGRAEAVIGTKQLIEGIMEITLEDGKGKGLCRRIVYKPAPHQLSFEINLDSGPFLCRDSIRLSINVRDMDGRAVKSDLTVSVFLIDTPSADAEKHPQKMFLMDPVFFGQCLNRQWNGPMPLDSITTEIILSAGYFLHSARNPDSIELVTDLTFYPELEGPSVSGIIIEKASGQPAGNRLIICSAIGTSSQFKVYKTGEDGKFRFALSGDLGYKDLVFRALGQDDLVDIRIDNPYSDRHMNMTLPPFLLVESRAPYITQLSVNKQVREAYKNTYEEPAGDGKPAREIFFYGEPAETVNLGVFIQLPVMEEIFRELVKTVIVYRKEGALKLAVIDNATRKIIGENPLFLLDGVPLFDHGRILEIDPALIGTIHVVDSKYFVGDLEMDGIIDIRSKQGKFQDFDFPASTVPNRFQSYAGIHGLRTASGHLPYETSGNHFPDFRSLLYWNPDIESDNEGRAEISFHASDVPGQYRIVVEGISADGYTGISAKELNIILRDPSGK